MSKANHSRAGEAAAARAEDQAAEPAANPETATGVESESLNGEESGPKTGPETSTASTLEEALARLADAEARGRDAQDRLLRIQAEMQNLRRRTEQDVERAHKFGQEKFASELLVVMDNLERAVDAAGEHESEAVKAIHEGVNLTLKSFADCFAKFHIAAVDPEGEPFDPALHQAMSIQKNDRLEPDTVIAVMQKGYTLHGRVLRPAMVIVSAEADT